MDNHQKLHILCRTCLKEIASESQYYCLDSSDTNTEIVALQHKLRSCVPELNLALVPDAVVCYDCFASINSTYDFKTACLQTEMKIWKHLQQVNFSSKPVDLRYVAQLSETLPEVPVIKEENDEFNEKFKSEELESEWLNPMVNVNVEEEKPVMLQQNYVVGCTNTDINSADCLSEEVNLQVYDNQGLTPDYILPNCDEQHISNIDSSFKCHICGHQCANKAKLVVHQKNHMHAKINKRKIKYKCHLKSCMKIHSGHKLFICTHCDYRSTRNSTLKRHIRVHTGEKPFSCTQCDYKASRKHHLETHLKIHVGEKSLHCAHCDYTTVSKTNLQAHLKMHTEEKCFRCKYCDYKTNKNSSLQRHLRIHTGEKPFLCTQCDYKANRKDHLESHMKIHTGEKPFKCALCDYKTNYKCSLDNHIKTHAGKMFSFAQRLVTLATFASLNEDQ